MPSAASSASIGVDAPAASCSVDAVHRRLVRLTSGPEADRARPGSRSTPRSSGGLLERGDERDAALAHPLERRCRVGRGSRSSLPGQNRRSGARSRLPAAHRCTVPMWPSRSATVQSGHDGTGASSPAAFAAATSAVDVRADRVEVLTSVPCGEAYERSGSGSTGSTSSGPLLSALFTRVLTGHELEIGVGRRDQQLGERARRRVRPGRATAPTPTPGASPACGRGSARADRWRAS